MERPWLSKLSLEHELPESQRERRLLRLMPRSRIERGLMGMQKPAIEDDVA